MQKKKYQSRKRNHNRIRNKKNQFGQLRNSDKKKKMNSPVYILQIHQIKIILLSIKQMTQSKYAKGFMPWQRTPNVLLVKSELGRTKATVRDIPHDQFVYGDKVPYGPQDSNQVMYRWKYHNPTDRQFKQKDLRKSNKQCVANNLHTASHFYNYRKDNIKHIDRKQGSKEIPILLPHDKFTYGRPLDLQDPIKILLGNGYAQHQAEKLRTFYETKRSTSMNTEKKLNFFITKSHMLVKANAKQKLKNLEWKRTPDDLFKLGKFKTQSFKVDTRRVQPKSENQYKSGNPESNEGEQQKN